ncbi:hypothetical protein L1987_83788 [Smallanthus sonchifolius]|uniref:Uncharacterized protein n=1 Tax=Smallanthus sonchifolius TaxID=185202 RepID=A0ACB8YH51_9ASTR|nr:hypothetical protein L1987_83788 [Smallanthus sonchifolius]
MAFGTSVSNKLLVSQARIKESLLIERLKRYEVARLQGPMVKPVEVTGEERFYMKKMAQKGSNYVPVGRRGVFGGVILNMHMHWKKHETVKVICKPCKPGQVQDYANEIARLSGGIPIQVIGDDTIVFYRVKDYVQPEVMSPIDTLSKKKGHKNAKLWHIIEVLGDSNLHPGRWHTPLHSCMITQNFEQVYKALEKSKYEQSLEAVSHFIAISEKELELYHRHIALYGDPADHNPKTVISGIVEPKNIVGIDSTSDELSENEDDYDDDDMAP